jgi:glycosyltransferase involved in cell wall biosynthesis
MQMFETLKPLLGEPGFTPDSLELRETVCVFANQAYGELVAAGPADKAAAAAALEGYARGGRLAANRFLTAIVQGLRYAATGEAEAMKASIRAALDEEAADVGVAMNTLYQIGRLAFTGEFGPEVLAETFDYETRHRHWLRLVALAERVAEGRLGGGPFSSNERVLVLIDQFLQPPHAPTRDALEYGRLFQDRGREVMIASSCAYGQQLYSAVMPGTRCVVNGALSATTTLTFEGREYRYHQPASGRFNNQTLIETLAAVEAFDPALVLTIGGQSLVGELLAQRRLVVQYPTFSGLPTTKALRFFMWGPPTAEEQALMDRLGLGDRYLFSQHPGFETPERTASLTRAQFAIPDEAFVFAVVGMRLDIDVGDDFLELMREIRGRRPNAHFAFIGDFEGFQARIGADPTLAGAASHLGFHSDIIAALELCDAYVNPTRRGGGSAIVHAIVARLPALSVKFGDAYEAVRDWPQIADYAALAEVACALADRGETYGAYVALAKANAPALQGKAAVVDKLLAAYDAYAAAHG